MIMHDINPEKEKVMLLIHPMMSSAEGMQECITDYMGDGYRYLIPDLNGHGDAVTKTYVSAKDEASAIHTYLESRGSSWASALPLGDVFCLNCWNTGIFALIICFLKVSAFMSIRNFCSSCQRRCSWESTKKRWQIPEGRSVLWQNCTEKRLPAP